ncbi:MAG: aminoacetone oxidase family FAD-binding enzyme [Candidatus Cloacimonadaceae bacterium]|jgi:hypothetical protein|nr:aminoacetone oxidase family FAD-binding enzyme [Candidatus Cloacimonadota bacterium]MDY0381566.1 aminoacetone oxidase family FAD-binding enzyme [Candidatus Cloacimonadaceae bacterium]MCB5264045.1 aminoacetone oxidase family FAD-binding enzyme [Candidatus Cloacimonadota bacterium]MCB5277185.1 aminoacetone oxidase family FAD-binding enzyme [Candidatus Cloacimonadota bacterium]MCK9434356.1 aminoacetone oxidase family FAD-binding enzyme [Candidatus Cloacimonadota bacterium]
MIAIIGAGPAAMGAAIAIGKNAVMLERNPVPGKKLLLSGKGQCNFTNACDSEAFLRALAEFRNWLKPAFYAFDNRAFIRLLEDAGCPVLIRDDDKVFPQSMKAGDVRDTLLKIALGGGASLITDCRITHIEAVSDGFRLVAANGKRYQARKIIIAAGGAAWPLTGSDGSSYRLAASLGHRVLKPRPALASVRIKDYSPFSACAGIALKTRMSFGKNRAEGDLLFTHTGFSGPVILNNSRFLQVDDQIRLLLADGSALSALLRRHPKKQLSSILPMLALPQSLAFAICRHLKIPAGTMAAELQASPRKLLESWLGSAPFRISALESLATAMSDFGGVDLKEVNTKTMQSRLTPGLFFAGESLAYSLPTGGFSIQMAFSTGYLAGKNVNSI